MANYRMEWRGRQVKEEAIAAVVDGLTEFGLRHEAEAKRELKPGRGVLTGTLRRSIHAAGPAYEFGSDDMPPSSTAPERGGQGAKAEKQGDSVSIVVGSGMRYARRIEALYAYMEHGFDRVKGQLIPIIEKHFRARGFR